MIAAVYLRVSTDRCKHCRRAQHEPDGRCAHFVPDQTEANQEPDCARLCAARGWEAAYFRERESSMKERPQWRAVLEAARRGQVGAVVFWALDRTGRNRVQVAHDLSELGRFGVHIASVQDAWLDQPPGPLRDLLIQIMGWVAEGERRRLVERTVAGVARARAQGKRIGRTPRDISGPGVVRALSLRTIGWSWEDCAKALVREGLAAPGLTSATIRRRCLAACEKGTPGGGAKAA